MHCGGIFQLIALGSRDKYLIDPTPYIYTTLDSGYILTKWNYPDNFVPLYKRNKYRLETILDHFASYITTLLCIKKIKKDINNPLWLPNELWKYITNIMKKDIESFLIGNNTYKRYYNEEEKYDNYTILYELLTYKKELHALKIQSVNTKDDLAKKKFKKIINTKKQQRINNYKRKIYSY